VKLGIVVAGVLWCVCTVRAFAPGTSGAQRDRVCVVYVCACCVCGCLVSICVSVSVCGRCALHCYGLGITGSATVPARDISARDSPPLPPPLADPLPSVPHPATGVSCSRCDHPARSLVLADILKSQCPSLIVTN